MVFRPFMSSVMMTCVRSRHVISSKFIIRLLSGHNFVHGLRALPFGPRNRAVMDDHEDFFEEGIGPLTVLAELERCWPQAKTLSDIRSRADHLAPSILLAVEP